MVTKGYKISLKALRINADYSIAEIAKLLKVSEASVEAWENYTSCPTLDQAKKLSLLYMVDIEDLTFGKFKSAKEIFRHNKAMLKKADENGYELLEVSNDGEITGFRDSRHGELITEL